MLAATLSVKSAPADETAAVNPTQSKPMAGMMEMMSPQPGFRLYGWIETGITGNFASPNDNQNFGRLLDDRAMNRQRRALPEDHRAVRPNY